jgi:hypothetical protein
MERFMRFVQRVNALPGSASGSPPCQDASAPQHMSAQATPALDMAAAAPAKPARVMRSLLSAKLADAKRLEFAFRLFGGASWRSAGVGTNTGIGAPR